jgi:branched-chain amino acid transport system substrate-binding protein
MRVTTKVLESLAAGGHRRRRHGATLGRRRSPAYELAKKRLGIAEPDSYETQATDWAASFHSPSPRPRPRPVPAYATELRRISQGNGTKVYQRVDGLKLLAEGKEINYEGASGPCDFTEIGDIIDCKFRYQQGRPPAKFVS